MRPRTRLRVGVPSRKASSADDPCVLRVNWAYRPMIPWDNVTISARARITQANKRLRSLTAGGGRHGMAISRGLVVQNGRCSRRSPSPSFPDWECDRDAPNRKRHMPLQNSRSVSMQRCMWWVQFPAQQSLPVAPVPPGPSGAGAARSPCVCALRFATGNCPHS